MKRSCLWLPVLLLAACAHAPPPDAQVPPFAQAASLYAPFSRSAAIQVALREWRLFGEPVNDVEDVSQPEGGKPERAQGLWQRVGEYWWLGLPGGAPEGRWTGEHDASGRIFPANQDGNYAWSAAFISYVMRIAGAGSHFPYSASHSTYINAAANRDKKYTIQAEDPATYAPVPGDLICLGRASSRGMVFADLPAGDFPSHCDIVVDKTPSPQSWGEGRGEGESNVPDGGTLTVIGGNVDDAVTMKHVPVGPTGLLVDEGGNPLDSRYAWFVVIRVGYEAE